MPCLCWHGHQLHFVTLNENWCNEFKHLFPDSHESIYGKWNDRICVSQSPMLFVSPANCYGYMDGGFDGVLLQQFPNAQKDVQHKFRDWGMKDDLHRPVFPIAACGRVKLTKSHHSILVCPTMIHPQNVSNTRNAFHSYLALLLWLEHNEGDEHVVLTSHCVGYGKMSAKDSVMQFKQAWDMVHDANVRLSLTFRVSPDFVLLPSVCQEQPPLYENRDMNL